MERRKFLSTLWDGHIRSTLIVLGLIIVVLLLSEIDFFSLGSSASGVALLLFYIVVKALPLILLLIAFAIGYEYLNRRLNDRQRKILKWIGNVVMIGGLIFFHIYMIDKKQYWPLIISDFIIISSRIRMYRESKESEVN